MFEDCFSIYLIIWTLYTHVTECDNVTMWWKINTERNATELFETDDCILKTLILKNADISIVLNRMKFETITITITVIVFLLDNVGSSTINLAVIEIILIIWNFYIKAKAYSVFF